MQVRAICPECSLEADWEVDLQVEEEIAWREGSWPTFGFLCTRCQALLQLELRWKVTPGKGARKLWPISSGSSSDEPVPRLVLVAHCPHNCGKKLGFRLEPSDPSFASPLEHSKEVLLGGYRCPDCDGEGCLLLQPVLETVKPRLHN